MSRQTARLLRQESYGEWTSAIRRVADTLAEVASRHGCCPLPLINRWKARPPTPHEPNLVAVEGVMDELQTVRVLGFAGSLRKNSYNRMALRAAAELLPSGMTLEIIDIAAIPPYNEDIKAVGYPAPVQEFRDKIAAADALLIATPEYNYSIPGVLKNAIDWASRPPNQPLDGKPLAIMGASPGMLGTARAQYHLRQVCVFVNMLPLNRPEVMIGQCQDRFDAEGRLTDEKTRQFIAQMMSALGDWTRRLRRGAPA